MLRRELLKLAVAVGAVGNDNGQSQEMQYDRIAFETHDAIPNLRLLDRFGRSRWSNSLRMGYKPEMLHNYGLPFKCVTANIDGTHFGCAVWVECEKRGMHIMLINGVDEYVVASIARHIVNGNVNRPIIMNGIEIDQPGENGELSSHENRDYFLSRRKERLAFDEIGGLNRFAVQYTEIHSEIGEFTGLREHYPCYMNPLIASKWLGGW